MRGLRAGRSKSAAVGDAVVEEWEQAATSAAEREAIAYSLGKTTTHLFGWEPAPHHLIWVDAIEKLLMRQIPDNRLLIIAPPAHAKTNWAGVATPAWYLGHNPYHHIIYLSSAQGQAVKSSIAVRDTIATNRRYRELFKDVLPDREKGWAAWRWFLQRPDAPGDKDATMLAAGVGSQQVLGSRGDVIMFDDINTQENTATAYRRDKVKEWVRTTAMSRETRDAVQLAIMTRWHSDDIANFFEKEAGYTVIHMPALGYWEDPGGKGSLDGTPLWEEEHDREDLAKKQRDLGPVKFSGMYMGDPVPEGGQLFKESFWHPYYVPFCHPDAQRVLKRHKRALKPPYNAVVNSRLESVPLTHVVLMVDTAMKENDEADYTHMALWAIGIDRQAYVLGEVHKRIDANKLYLAFIRYWRQNRPDVAGIEDRSSGTQLLQDIQQKQPIPVVTFSPSEKKEERAKAQAHIIDGAAHLPNPDLYYRTDANGVKEYYIDKADWDDPQETPEQWILDWIAEHAGFPAERNDDRVDTTVMFAEYARGLVDWWSHEAEDVGLQLPEQIAKTSPIVDGRMPMGPEAMVGDHMQVGWSGSGREPWPGR